MNGAERRARLRSARLYLCTGIRDGAEDLARFLEAVLSAGVDIVQMREKAASRDAQEVAGRVFRRFTDEHASLFIVNDDPTLATSCGADGVHLGQQDETPENARALLGEELLIGRSTHAREELLSALEEPVDYLGVGPVHETPTKAGRSGVGLDYVQFAVDTATIPFFVTGGMNAKTIPETLEAGAKRVVVVRAITEAHDPGAAAKEIRALLS